jgi:tetratricopeptide (TPR) repeat protein
MMQAGLPPALLFAPTFQRGIFRKSKLKMYRSAGKHALTILIMGCLLCGSATLGQQSKVLPTTQSALSPEKAISLAEQGQCKESISALKRAMAGQAVSAATRKQAGVVGIRCGLAVDDRDSTLDFIHLLNKQFPRDPDVLFVIIHAYSDLSTRTAQDLGRTAPQSMAAHKLNAEALEMQGKWEPAQLEYEGMIQKEPNARGIHFLLGRLLLSRPDAPPDAAERARQEFLKELQIDPNNADAQYILGELARRDEKWDEAISRFSAAAKINPGFSEAYLGWGATLLTVKKYEEAISPLRTAERIAPGNPDTHHALATALERSGHKEEAAREFAIHRSLTSGQPANRPE